ncbi:MAG: endonuclease/exonuclease/phosphatase family protein [Paludibacter sp.]|nr:endonuclease/exonuclease/phosphatase family protein [Paludibacter sp.]
MIDKIKQIAGDAPVICMGDFNANPSEEGVYQTMTSKLLDSRTIAQLKSEKSIGTFNGWNHLIPSLEENFRIDYIFTNIKQMASYSIINDFYQPGAFPSDHFPVVVKLLLP